MLSYDDIGGFYDWLNDVPDDLGEDEFAPSWEELGLKPNAPQSAKRAYKKYCEAEAQAKKEHRLL